MSLRCAIHAPEFMPTLVYVAKLLAADVFILLDTVDFNREALQHRLKVKGPAGPQWVTIPFVHRHPQTIVDVQIAHPVSLVTHLRTLEACYRRAPGFDWTFEHLVALLGTERYPDKLAEVSIASVEWLWRLFCGWRRPTKILRASQLPPVAGQKSDLVLGFCQAVGATTYLAGRTSAATYLDHASFAAAGIAVEVQSFTHPVYPQRFGGPFLPNLSVLDLLFNCGADSFKILRDSGNCGQLCHDVADSMTQSGVPPGTFPITPVPMSISVEAQ